MACPINPPRPQIKRIRDWPQQTSIARVGEIPPRISMAAQRHQVPIQFLLDLPLKRVLRVSSKPPMVPLSNACSNYRVAATVLIACPQRGDGKSARK